MNNLEGRKETERREREGRRWVGGGEKGGHGKKANVGFLLGGGWWVKQEKMGGTILVLCARGETLTLETTSTCRLHVCCGG